MMKRTGSAGWKYRLISLLMVLMLCMGLFAVSAAQGDPLKPEDVVSTDGNIILHKQAERIGPDEWEVTVSATVNRPDVEAPKLEVVFVLDTSLSMKECANEEEHIGLGVWKMHTHDDSCPDGCDIYMIQHRSNNSCHYWTNTYADVQITPNRLTVATQAAEKLISSLPTGTTIGRVSFSTNAFVESTYTSGIYAAGQTYLMKGVDLAVGQFSTSNRTKILVIITDGAATDNAYSSAALTGFTNAGGIVFTVGFNHQDPNLAGMVANGGSYYHAGNPGELTEALNAIGAKITSMVVDPMGPKVSFDITETIPSNGNLTTQGDTIYWTPANGQALTGKVVEYRYKVKLNNQAVRETGVQETPLNNPTYFRYGVEQNGETTLYELNFPIPEATYAHSSVQVSWVDQDGNALTVPGYAPTEVEKLICDYSNQVDDGVHQVYTPAYATDYRAITERIEVPGGNGAYYQYVGTDYTADGNALTGMDDVDVTNPVAHEVVHRYVLVQPWQLPLMGEKTLEGREFRAGDAFDFELSIDEKTAGNNNDQAPLPPAAGGTPYTITVKPAAGSAPATIDFGLITFAQPGVYEYTVREVASAQGDERIELDETQYALRVVVTENADRTLSMAYTITNKATGAAVDAIAFTNIYPVTGELVLNKTVVRSTSSTENFTFRITADSDELRADMQKWVGKNPTLAIFENGAVVVRTGDIAITDGNGNWTLTLPEFPVGIYTVTEDAAGNYETTYQVNDGTATQTPAEIEILEDALVTVSVKNENPVGNLEIGKVIPDADTIMKADSFAFAITGPDTFTGSVSYTLNGAAMTGTVNAEHVLLLEGVKDGDVIVLENVPAGDYVVSETAADDNRLFYNASYSDAANAGKVTVVKGETAQLTVTNNPTQTLFTKIWSDENDLYGLRCGANDFVRKLIVLRGRSNLQSGCTAGDFVVCQDAVITVSADPDVSVYYVTVLGLPELGSGESYYIAEADLSPYIAKNVILSAEFTVNRGGMQETALYHVFAETARHEFLNELVTIVDVSVLKAWNDANDQDGLRPESVTVQLYADGTVKGDAVALSETNNWATIWTDLPKYADGVEIVYTVDETEVPEGYTKSVTGDAATGYTITNTHEAELISVAVLKAWNDANDQDGLRPASVTVQLYADGTAKGDAVALSETNNWATIWTDLPKYADGAEIVYTVDETEVPAGYTKSVAGDAATGYTITNTHVPATTELSVLKSWNDANDQDGLRPESVTVQLYADGTACGDAVALSETNNWATIWTDLPKYADSVEIVYTVDETEVPEGYTKSVTGDAATGYTITNTHEAELISVAVLKAWNDANDQDGLRPESVTVQLYADGTAKGDAVVLNEDNGWTTTWTDLPKYADGAEIVYTVDETEVPDGYTKSVTGDAATGYTITNTHVPATTELSVLKAWNDANDQDGLRPESVTVQLYADGTAKADAVELNEANGWTTTWTDLPKYADGVEIVYTVDETEVPAGYTKSMTGDAATGYTITNTHEAELISVAVLKAWNDAEDQDGLRPESVTVQLYADGTAKGDAVVLNEDNGWTTTWTDLPKYADGVEIVYTVDETEVPDGYTKSVTGDAATGYTITNTHEAELISVAVLKAWNDAEDQDGVRPESVTVQLYADGTAKGDVVVLNEANGWTATWTDLPKYADGAEIVYTVDETEVPAGYTKSVTGDAATGYTITNTHEAELISVAVLKSWNDANDQDGLRPESVTVQLYADGTAKGDAVVLNEDNGWTATWTDLPKYAEGVEIVYTVDETAVPDGYTKSVTGDAATGYTITNTHEAELISVAVLKAWNDAEDQDGLRPESVTVQLYADGTAKGDVVVLNEANGWATTWTDLPKYADGAEIVYTVDETAVPDGYTKSVTGDAATGYIITNTHEAELISVAVLKSWNDANDQDGLRPESVTVQLYADGTACGDAVALSETNNWATIWTDLPKYTDGAEIVYTVDETEVPAGYTKSVTGDAATGYTITNTHKAELISVAVLKAWNDANDQDGLRPESVTVQLYADGTVKGDAVVLNEANGWTATWTDLPKYADGVEIVYTVDETEVPAGYTKSVTGDTKNGFTITNTHEAELISVAVLKAWNDANDQDGVRPESVTVQLYADGTAKGDAVELNEANGWATTWTDLPKYADGVEIVYTVDETEVPDGYTKSVTGDAATGYTITNMHVPATTEIAVLKAWNDANDQDGLRPESVTVQLYADGTAKGDAVVLNEANGWTATWTDLPKYADGAEIVYTVDETAVPDGYTKSVTGDAATGYTITNTHVPATTELSVLKAWNDANDQDGLRPASVTVQLYADGTAKGDAVVLNEDNGWTTTWTDLPKYADGVEIVYTVDETEVPAGYTKSVTGDTVIGYTITNTHEAELISVAVLKSWNDANDQDGLRPESVTVQLYADGTAKGDAVVLNEDNGWTTTWTDLPKYADGAEIVYTVDETEVPEGYTKSVTGDAATGYTITNTHVPAITEIAVLKAWNDAEDQDGLRPASVTVQLYADGTAKGDAVELNEDNGWTATWTDLPKYADGAEIVYTVDETAVPDGYTKFVTGDAATGYTITNTHEAELISVAVLKAWNDAEDQDGVRPESVTVQLYADGTAKGDAVVLNEANGWTTTWTDLPKYADGAEIVYTVDETAVPDGYTKSVTGDAATGYTITNTHVPATTEIAVLKAWNDANDQDGLRPESVTVQLYADGTAKGDAVVLNEANGWTATWTDLPKYADGVEIVYTVDETAVPDGYTKSVTGDTKNGFTITNTHVPATTEIAVLKAWNDANDQDGLRPESVTVQLYADGTACGDAVALSETNNWATIWTDLPKYADGAEIVYTVDETEVPAGYTKSVTGDAGTGYTITNTHVPAITEISVLKAWNDAEDQDGVRPESVTVQLYADGTACGDAVALSETNNWATIWTDLTKYADGVEIVYTVDETEVPEGYTKSVTGDAATGYTITNTHAPATTEIAVLKAWNDANDQDGLRPESVTVQLYADGTAKGDAVVLNEANGWTTTWTDLPKYADGAEIVYTVDETAVPDGYTKSVTGDAATGYTITNTHETELISVAVLKAWNDAEDQDGVRPESVTVQLYADGTAKGDVVVLNEDNGWTTTWTDLPKYADGAEIVYTVDETEVPAGYTKSATGDAATGYTITNTHEAELISVAVLKAWNDANDQDGLRPESVTVQLYADGTAKGDAIVLNEANGWTTTWTDLPKYADGAEIVYTVDETEVPEGYTKSVTGDAATGYTITNTHVPATTEIAVLKAWNDANDQDGVRPESVTVQLYADGTACGDAVALSETNNWATIWTDLPKYADGVEIVYTVDETEVPEGYTKSMTGDAATGYTITNTHEAELISVAVLKAWNDAEDQDGLRPESVTVQLYADGTAKGDVVVLNEANGWTTTWTDLPKYADGAEIVYTVDETAVPDGYTKSISGDAATGYTITNTHVPATTELSVLKAWNDANDQDGLRPESVTVQLYADGTAKGDAVVLNEDNGWATTWTDLPKYADGAEIVYTVDETAVPDGYTKSISGDAATGYTITNTHVPATTEIAVLKAWDDANDQDGLRPESVTVQLYADGTAKGDAVELNEDNGWATTWTDLPKYADGVEIVYTVDETEVPAGYTKSMTGDAATGYTITNTHEAELISVAVLKAWNDANDQDGLRPENVTVQLYADGTVKGDAVVLNEANGWTTTWTDLPKYADGVEIVYTVDETAVPDGYTKSVTGDAATGYTITNTHEAELISVAVLKEWNDAEDQDGVRPESVTVQLYADGTACGDAVALSETNNWATIWTDLPKYTDGVEIVYTVDETEVPAGYTKSVTGDAATGYTITNTHVPATTEIAVLKAWNDANDQDGLRPESVTVQLYADGTAKGDAVELNEDNGWTTTWTDLPKYADGVEIVYMVDETAVPDGYTKSVTGDAATGYTITNTHVPATTELSVLKAWNDANDQDGLRPESVTVQLYADGTAEGDAVKLNEDNGWATTWTDLPKYADGAEIVYTVDETAVPDGYTKSVTGDAATGYTITNTHEPIPASVEIALTAGKMVNGRLPKEGEVFSFELLDAAGNLLQTVQNDGGTITFAPLTFGAADAGRAFSFVVREAEDSRPYFATDSRTYSVGISVVLDEESGRLTTTQQILCGDATVDAIIFENTYEAEGTLQLTATKTVNGEIPTAEQVYEFSLEGEGISLTASNEGESIIFDQISYDLADVGTTFTYTIRETTPGSDNLITDATVYTVTVTLANNGDGTLTAMPVYTVDGEDVEAIAFDNHIGAPLTISKTVAGCTTDLTFGIKVNLYGADGEELTEPLYYTGDVNGQLVSGDIIQLGHGQKICIEGLIPGMKYEVTEVTTPAFTTMTNGTAVNGAAGSLTEDGAEVAFVNTLVTTEFTVTKQWRGGEGGQIRLTLYANGEKLDPQPECLRDGNVYTFRGLPRYDANGDLIIYTAKEKYMEGYTTMYVNPAPYEDVTKVLYDGGTVINKRSPELSFQVQKVWDGLEEGEEAPDITLVLCCNGVETDYPTPDPDKNGWYKYYDLPRFVGNEPAVYTVIEKDVAGYKTVYTLANGEAAAYADNGGTITNVKIPQTGDQAQLALWAALLGASVTLLLALRRRKHA